MLGHLAAMLGYVGPSCRHLGPSWTILAIVVSLAVGEIRFGTMLEAPCWQRAAWGNDSARHLFEASFHDETR